ncbi:hypothetical protein GCM10027287_24530 [Bordetella muralis]
MSGARAPDRLCEALTARLPRLDVHKHATLATPIQHQLANRLSADPAPCDELIV